MFMWQFITMTGFSPEPVTYAKIAQDFSVTRVPLEEASRYQSIDVALWWIQAAAITKKQIIPVTCVMVPAHV